MAEFQTKIQVNQPVAEVFAKFMDIDNMGKWLTGFKKIETVSGNPGDVGSKYKLTFEEKGKEIVMDEEVLEVKENEKFVFRMEMPQMSSHSDVEFHSVNSGTEVVSSTTVEGKGFMWKLAIPMMKSQMKKRQEQDFNKLKALLEFEW